MLRQNISANNLPASTQGSGQHRKAQSGVGTHPHHNPWQKMKTPSPVPYSIFKPLMLFPFPLEMYKSRCEVWKPEMGCEYF